jgi:hypothetical protein
LYIYVNYSVCFFLVCFRHHMDEFSYYECSWCHTKNYPHRLSLIILPFCPLGVWKKNHIKKKWLFINISFFFQFFSFKILVYFSFYLHFPLNFTIFLKKIPNKNFQVKKIQTQKKTCWLGGGRGLIQLFNAKISRNSVTFTFT